MNRTVYTCLMFFFTAIVTLFAGSVFAQYSDNTPSFGSLTPPNLTHMLDIELSGNLAYVGGTGGLWIIDVSNINSPVLKSNYRPSGSGAGGGQVYGIGVDGNNLFLCLRSKGLDIMNISNPSSPVRVGSRYQYFGNRSYEHAIIFNDIAYLAVHDYGVEVLDITNPSNPLHITEVLTSNAFTLARKDNYIYVADGTAGLTVLDITDPRSPKNIISVSVSALALDIVVNGNYAYLAAGSSGLYIFDISDPESPVIISNYYKSGFTTHINVSGNFAYLANWDNVDIVDIADPFNPNQAGSQHSFARAMAIAVKDNTFYVGDWRTLRIYQFENQPVPDINTLPLEMNFGTIPVGGLQKQSLRIDNFGKEPLTISSLTVDATSQGKGFTVEQASFTLNTNESRLINVTYEPVNTTKVSGFITILSNDPDESQKIIPILGGVNNVGVGDIPADFNLLDTEGSLHRLGDYIAQQKVIVIALFASW